MWHNLYNLYILHNLSSSHLRRSRSQLIGEKSRNCFPQIHVVLYNPIGSIHCNAKYIYPLYAPNLPCSKHPYILLIIGNLWIVFSHTGTKYIQFIHPCLRLPLIEMSRSRTNNWQSTSKNSITVCFPACALLILQCQNWFLDNTQIIIIIMGLVYSLHGSHASQDS